MKVINITQKQLNLNLRQRLIYLGDQRQNCFGPRGFQNISYS